MPEGEIFDQAAALGALIAERAGDLARASVEAQYAAWLSGILSAAGLDPSELARHFDLLRVSALDILPPEAGAAASGVLEAVRSGVGGGS